jgi:hypothetical protein
VFSHSSYTPKKCIVSSGRVYASRSTSFSSIRRNGCARPLGYKRYRTPACRPPHKITPRWCPSWTKSGSGFEKHQNLHFLSLWHLPQKNIRDGEEFSVWMMGISVCMVSESSHRHMPPLQSTMADRIRGYLNRNICVWSTLDRTHSLQLAL